MMFRDETGMFLFSLSIDIAMMAMMGYVMVTLIILVVSGCIGIWERCERKK
ncbi:hypothetical protein KV701_01890 [Limnobaculum sp. M2-1]|nr:hypothetical protein [Limnobaculum sp. M2-1]